MPRKPQTQDKYIVRLPEGLRSQIQEMAYSQNESMNAAIVRALGEAVAQYQQELGASTPLDQAEMATKRIFDNTRKLKRALADARQVGPQIVEKLVLVTKSS